MAAVLASSRVELREREREGECGVERSERGRSRPNVVVVVKRYTTRSDSVRWPYAQFSLLSRLASFLLLLCEEVVIARGALVDCIFAKKSLLCREGGNSLPGV